MRVKINPVRSQYICGLFFDMNEKWILFFSEKKTGFFLFLMMADWQTPADLWSLHTDNWLQINLHPEQHFLDDIKKAVYRIPGPRWKLGNIGVQHSRHYPD